MYWDGGQFNPKPEVSRHQDLLNAFDPNFVFIADFWQSFQATENPTQSAHIFAHLGHPLNDSEHVDQENVGKGGFFTLDFRHKMEDTVFAVVGALTASRRDEKEQCGHEHHALATGRNGCANAAEASSNRKIDC